MGNGYNLRNAKAVKAARAMKLLRKSGKLTPDMFAGLKQMENLLKVLRESESIYSLSGGVHFEPPDFGEVPEPDFFTWPPTPEDRNLMRVAVDQQKKRADDLKSTKKRMGKIDPFLGGFGGGGSDGLRFISTLLTSHGGVQENLSSRLGGIKTSVDFHGRELMQKYKKWELAPDTEDADLWYKVLANMGKKKKKATKLAKRRTAQEEAQEARRKRAELEGSMTGPGELNALNTLREYGIVRFAHGGNVAGEDKVPAMLTPGEFVMSPEAVQKHGVGFMRDLNRGQTPGFRRGGVVGGVAYRRWGSKRGERGGGGMTMGLDITGIQGVFDNFNAKFTTNLDNVVAHFSDMTSAMNTLAGAMGKGMVLTHQFTGDLALAFKIENADVLKKTIADAIIPHMSQIINDHIESELHKKFRTEE